MSEGRFHLPQAGLAGVGCYPERLADIFFSPRAKRAVDLALSESGDLDFLARAKRATDLTASGASDPPSLTRSKRAIDLAAS